MAITGDSNLAGPTEPESLLEAIAYVRAHGNLSPFTEAYIRALYRLCVAIGLRFELAFAQWCDETDVGGSELWRSLHNPAGIGALPDGTYVGITYQTAEESALGHLVHLWLYVKSTTLPPELAPYVKLDPRWQAAIDAGNVGKGKTLKGLAGSWATNLNYAVQIAGHANKAFGPLPEKGNDVAETIIFGKVPMPAYGDDYIPDFEGMAAGWYGKRMLLGFVWHRMVGTVQGTRAYFRQPGTGLTDFGVGVAGPDAASDDGVLYRWNDPLGVRSGWANGRIIAPWGDGLAFINEYAPQYGLDIANRGQVSLEISGQYLTPLTPKSRAIIVALTAYYADLAHIPWDVFPIWPGHGYSFVRYHQELTGPEEKVCPGDVVIGETATLMATIGSRMRQYQTSRKPQPIPSYAAPHIPDWLKADLAAGVMRDHVLNTAPVWGAERIYTAIRDTPRLQSATSAKDAAIVGPPIKKGETFTGSHLIGSTYVLTPYGTRVRLADLTPEVIIRPRSA